MSEVIMVLLRGTITFFSLLIFCRLLGKTQVSQFSYFEYVTGITIGSIAGELTTDLNMRPWPMYVGLATWVGLALLTQVVALKDRWTAKLLDGEPAVLIQNGQVLEGTMRSLRMRMAELNSMLRAQGVFDIKAVEFAVLEPNGNLSILKRSQERPVTPADLNVPTAYEGMAVELIVDGQIMEQNLRRLHVNRAWLLDRLREQGAQSPGEVFHAAQDTSGRIYLDLYRDRVPPADQVGDYPGPN